MAKKNLITGPATDTPLSPAERLRAKRDTFELLQFQANGISSPSVLGPLVRAIARTAHAEYPQYSGYFDHFTPVYLLRDIRTKAGLAFRQGDHTVAHFSRGEKFFSVYSIRTGFVTSVPFEDIEFMD